MTVGRGSGAGRMRRLTKGGKPMPVSTATAMFTVSTASGAVSRIVQVSTFFESE